MEAYFLFTFAEKLQAIENPHQWYTHQAALFTQGDIIIEGHQFSLSDCALPASSACRCSSAFQPIWFNYFTELR